MLDLLLLDGKIAHTPKDIYFETFLKTLTLLGKRNMSHHVAFVKFNDVNL